MKYFTICIVALMVLFTAASCGEISPVNNITTEEPQTTETTVTSEVGTARTTEAALKRPNGPIRVSYYTPDAALPYLADGTLVRWIEYAYNADGNKTQKTNYDGGNTVVSWEEYAYDANGNQVKLTLYSHPGSYLLKEEEPSDEDELIEWQEFQYDGDGNPVKVTYYNADGTKDRWSEYLYDPKGDMIKETVYNSNGSTDWVSNWNEYAYDDNGIKNLCTVYNGSDGSFSSQTKYQYNNAREQFEEIYYNEDGEAIGTFAYAYQYDDEGRILNEIYYSSDGNVGYWLAYQY